MILDDYRFLIVWRKTPYNKFEFELAGAEEQVWECVSDELAKNGFSPLPDGTFSYNGWEEIEILTLHPDRNQSRKSFLDELKKEAIRILEEVGEGRVLMSEEERLERLEFRRLQAKYGR